MSEKKEIHIVFQVLNFIKVPHNDRLLPVDRLLLLMLASHYGSKGIYPSVTTLANEIQMSKTYTKQRLNFLEELKLIKILRKNGQSSSYEFLMLSTTGQPQLTGELQLTGQPQLPTPVNPSCPHRSTGVTPININNQYKRNNKERGREKQRPALSDSFLPNDENLILAKDLRLNIEDELESFKNRHKGKKTQYEFSRWLKTAKEYQNRTPAKVEPPKPREWNMAEWEEQDKIERAKRAKELAEHEKMIDQLKNSSDYIPFKERVRMHNEKHGVLTNGATNGTDTTANNGGRNISTKN
jgi:hypothetical protein